MRPWISLNTYIDGGSNPVNGLNGRFFILCKEVFTLTNSKGKLENAKDKIVGEVKEAAGKVTGNEELELKGKIQSKKADVKKKAGELKESVAEKVNDIIDKK